MSDYKLVFLDIDGTILKPDHKYELSTKEAILQLQKKGMEVILATGRPLPNIIGLAKELSISSFISYNGAHCLYQGEEIFREPVKTEDVSKFYQLAMKHNHDFVFYSDQYNFFSTIDNQIVQKFIDTFDMDNNIKYTPDSNKDILGVTIITAEKQAEAYYQDFNNLHYTSVNVKGLTTCFDVIRNYVNKGIAVQNLIEKLGYPKESTIAFGDGMNDKEMLMTVGEGIAMGNGHPELFQYAKDVTTSVEDAGIYNGLKKLGILE